MTDWMEAVPTHLLVLASIKKMTILEVVATVQLRCLQVFKVHFWASVGENHRPRGSARTTGSCWRPSLLHSRIPLYLIRVHGDISPCTPSDLNLHHTSKVFLSNLGLLETLRSRILKDLLRSCEELGPSLTVLCSELWSPALDSDGQGKMWVARASPLPYF